jgi:hypothetical protein
MRPYLVLAALGGIGLHVGLLAEDAEPAVADAATHVIPRAAVTAPSHARARPQLASVATVVDDSDELELEEVRGHAPIEDPAELAFVFSVGGETYLRLSEVERASARGAARMVDDGEDLLAVVAGVEPHALPAHLRSWVGRDVVVDGECQARVVGFAEVSRVSGPPPRLWDDEEEDEREAPDWTAASIVEHGGVTLAARLDRCEGMWARATDYSPAAIAARIEAPALEAAARAELLARAEHDAVQDQWRDSGGEGDWRDAASITTGAYLHPHTEETWIFVRAVNDGPCGEPNVARMAAYRVVAGKPRPFAELDFAYSTILQVVDLDGDGQPELILGESDHVRVVDLANEYHTAIDVPSFADHGCGC